LDAADNLEAAYREYVEANQFIRHYSGLRFAVFTVYFAVMGGLVVVSFGNPQEFAESVRLGAMVAGMVVSLAFLGFELRLDTYLTAYRDRAKLREPLLGFSLHRDSDNAAARVIHTRVITRLLYCAAILAWLLMLVGALTGKFGP
jgi:hypothetical protein